MTAFTPPGPTPKWLFVDMNAYFASCEQQDRPALRGKPVAVVPMQTDSTCAIAASYEAKACGIKTGTPIYEARRKCPDLICVLARHDVYVDYHHRILAEIVRHTPINKVWSVDELSSQLTREHQSVVGAVALAHRIKIGLRKNVGEYIRCSIGIAPNSFLAKVATDMRKPDGLTVLETTTLRDQLIPLHLTDLPGINTAMERHLWNAGIRSMAQLWDTSPKQARRIWGGLEGERFWYNLHGYDVPDRVTHRSMIGHSRILDPELRAPDAAYQVARRLTIKAATRLRRMDYYATHFALSVRVVDGPRWAADIRISPTQDNFAFMHALKKLWDTMIQDTGGWRFRKVSVTFHGLKQRGDITPDLFEISSPTLQRQIKRAETVSNVIDAINARYGAEAVRFGVSPRTRAGYVGTKIAFNRVPDMAEFSE